MGRVLQRSDWHGDPFKHSETFRLVKGGLSAECQVWMHRLGWELRLMAAGELVHCKICQSQEEVVALSEGWKAAMLAKGWR